MANDVAAGPGAASAVAAVEAHLPCSSAMRLIIALQASKGQDYTIGANNVRKTFIPYTVIMCGGAACAICQ